MGPGMPGGPNQGGAEQPKKDEPAGSRITIKHEDRTIDFTLDLVLDQATFGKMLSVATLTASILRTEMDKADRRLHHELAEAAKQTAEKGLSEANLPAGRFPPGAFTAIEAKTRSANEPQNRISWMAALLPQLGQDAVYRRLNFQHDWRNPANWLAGKTIVPEFLDPLYPDATRHLTIDGVPIEYGATHFVGIAGVGLDAALYPRDDAAYIDRRGIFSYDKSATLKEVAEGRGLANTIMIMQVPYDGPAGVTPWIAGGGATVRGVPEKNSIAPFVLSTDRSGKVIQHNGKRGTYALMADSSVRFIDQNVSDDVFKAMCTIGGPAPEGFDLKTEPHTKLIDKPKDEERLPEKPVTRPPTKGPSDVLPPGWIRFYAPEGYSVGMPQQPVASTKDVPGIGKVTAHAAPVAANNKITLYAVVGVKLSGDALALAKTPDGMRKLALLDAPADVKILKEEPAAQDGLKGMEMVAEATDEKAGKITVISRAFLANDLLIAVAVAGIGTVPTAEAPPFFATLRVGDKAPPAPAADTSSKNDTAKNNTAAQPTGKVPAGWVPFKSPVANYSLAFPQQPTQQSLQAPVVGEVKIFMTKLSRTQAPISTLAFPISPEELKAGEDTVFNSFVVGFMGSSGAQMQSSKKITCGSSSGREYVYAPKAKQGQSSLGCMRVYLVGNYVVVLASPNSGNPPDAETMAFFDSLKIGN